ncbi:DUF5682 family protein [Streptomyces goshikiensis]|uniref:DUF5682 family protein n=1 Tax=Streptomyces goshikiensis TaxID=1942 RepID=UPI0036983840
MRLRSPSSLTLCDSGFQGPGLLCGEGPLVSFARVVEAVRPVEALAVTRGRPLPGLVETTDAVKAAHSDDSDVPLSLVHDRLIVDDLLGEVPPPPPPPPYRCSTSCAGSTTRSAAGSCIGCFTSAGASLRPRPATGAFRESRRPCWGPELTVRVAEAVGAHDSARARHREGRGERGRRHHARRHHAPDRALSPGRPAQHLLPPWSLTLCDSGSRPLRPWSLTLCDSGSRPLRPWSLTLCDSGSRPLRPWSLTLCDSGSRPSGPHRPGLFVSSLLGAQPLRRLRLATESVEAATPEGRHGDLQPAVLTPTQEVAPPRERVRFRLNTPAVLRIRTARLAECGCHIRP